MRNQISFEKLYWKTSAEFRIFALIAVLFLQVPVSLMAQMSPPGNALKFVWDGSDITYVSTPNASALISGSAFTIEGWVYPSGQLFGSYGYNLWDHYFGFRNDLNCDFYILQLAADTVEARFRNSSGTKFTISAAINGMTNQWQHFALVFNGSMLTLYHNGAVIGSIPSSGSLSNPNQELFIGGIYDYIGDDFAFPLRGRVDELRMWNTAQSQADIQANMLNVVSPSSAGLVLYYKFDQSSGHYGCG